MSTQATPSSFRTQFKPTTVAAQVEADQKTQAFTQNGDRNADFIKLEPGRNILRIYPPHPGEGTTFSEPCRTVYLPMLKPEYDTNNRPVLDRNQQPVMKEGFKAIFDSKLHGGTQKDIVDEYCKFAEYMAKAMFEGDAQKIKTFLDPVKGQPGIANGHKGIQYQMTWVMYVDKLVGESRVFGRFQYKTSIKKRLQEIASVESSTNPLGIEPFTSVDEGLALSVTYNKEATQPSDYYKVDVYAPMIQGTGGQIQLFPISDERLDTFLKVKSLKELYSNVYTRRDFELALNALEYFDAKHRLGLFQEPEFIAIIEEIDAYYPHLSPVAKDKANVATNDTDLPFGQAVTNTIPAPAPVNQAPAYQAPAAVPGPVYQAPLPAPGNSTDDFLNDLGIQEEPAAPQAAAASGLSRLEQLKLKKAQEAAAAV